MAEKETFRLSVRNLNIGFKNNKTLTNVVSGVSFDVYPGEIVSLVGESGCGKSASCLAIGRLLAANAVTEADGILFRHQDKTVDLAKLPNRDMRKIRIPGSR